MNKVLLLGRLTKVPELRYTTTGKAVMRFTLAVNKKLSKEKRQEMENNGQAAADFISCQAWQQTAEIIANYCTQGSQLAVEGQIQTGSYEKNGQRIYTTDVLVNSIDLVGNKNSNQNNNQQNNNQDEDFEGNGFFPVDNSDIPF